MDVTRDVILDLLPIYLAGEATQDTKDLVERYLENDQELAALAKKIMELDHIKDIKMPLDSEDQMKAYLEAQRIIKQRTITLAGIIAAALLSLLSLGALIYFMLVSVP
jgi:hypothetical protein